MAHRVANASRRSVTQSINHSFNQITKRSIHTPSLRSAVRISSTRVTPSINQSIKRSNTRAFSTETDNASATESAEPAEVDPRSEPREQMEYDVVIIGAGPAGLAAAIRLKQQAIKQEIELSVCILEKGASVGAHILSGNVFEPRSLNELFPEWKTMDESARPPLHTPVTKDEFSFFLANSALPMPTPPTLHNEGNYIISLGALCQWLSGQAEELGVEIFAGFSASEVLYETNENGETSVVGVATSDMGVGKAGDIKSTFTRGIELRAKQTLFAEGARGSCSEEVMSKFNLRKDCDVQTYGLGMKEIWEIDPSKHVTGTASHSIGWPAPLDAWFGSFLYHLSPEDPSANGKHRVLLGAVVGLDYDNPYLSPYQTFQQWKTHPKIAKLLEGGKCVSYGARVINEGGLQAVPQLTFNGGALIGCSAGFLNVPKIKGSHTAMWSGIEAADAIVNAAKESTDSLNKARVINYETNLRNSWVFEELKEVRNVQPSHKFGLLGWLGYSALSTYLLRGREPWTFKNGRTDEAKTKHAKECKPIAYPKADGKLTFELLTNLARSGVHHEEDQPCHLRIKPGMEDVPLKVSLPEYDGPEQRFCPAKVYEYVPDEKKEGAMRLQINQSNCVHCKTCDIKTPKNYIRWTVPEGAGGPNYENM